MLSSLASLLEECHSRSDVKGVVITGSGKNFCAGFDIAQFQSAESPEKAVSGASEILTKVLEEVKFPFLQNDFSFSPSLFFSSLLFLPFSLFLY